MSFTSKRAGARALPASRARLHASLAILSAAALGLAAASSACGSSDGGGADALADGGEADGSAFDGGASSRDATLTAVDAGSDGDSASTDLDAGSTRCPRATGPADGERRVLVSHPFDKDGNKTNVFELLSLSAAGVLSRPGVTFQMGTALESNIAFTPDGAVALVAQDDGTVGVVRFDGAGAHVVHAGFSGSFYAARVIMDPRGDRAYVVDSNTSGNHGGVYGVDIACDGTLTDRGLVFAASAPAAMTLLPNGTDALLELSDFTEAGTPNDSVLASFGGAVVAEAVGNAFPGGNAIASDIAVMPGGRFALVADDGVLVGNRVAMVELPQITAKGLLSVPNPAAVVASPFDNAALVLSSDGTDGIRLLSYAPDAAAPFKIVSEITYVHGKPELPSFAVTITRGALTGLVLVAEASAVRGLTLHPDAGVTDSFKLTFGATTADDIGVIGAQP